MQTLETPSFYNNTFSKSLSNVTKKQQSSIHDLERYFTGTNKPTESDPKLFVPFIDNPCLPERVRKFFRFGVPELSNAKGLEDDNERTVTLPPSEIHSLVCQNREEDSSVLRPDGHTTLL